MDTAAGHETLSGIEAFRACTVRMFENARLQAVLFSQILDRRTYGAEEVIVAIKDFALRHRRARLRVLVAAPQQAMRAGNRLVELGRMLSSRIEFRELPESHRRLREEYLLTDERSLLYRAEPKELDAQYWPDAPLHARGVLREFEAIWQEAPPARELSELRL